MGDKTREVFEAARKIFCDGIYIKSNVHRCGWDFVDFQWIDPDELDEYKFTVEDFNDYYSSHDYEGFTLSEILDEVGEKGWCFEISGVDNLQ